MSETETLSAKSSDVERPVWLDDRLMRLRAHAMSNPHRPAGYRGLAVLRARAAHPHSAIGVNLARGLAGTIATFPARVVHPEDLLTGEHLFGSGPAAELDWWSDHVCPGTEMAEKLDEMLDESALDDAQRAAFRELSFAVRHGPVLDSAAALSDHLPEVRTSIEAGVYFGSGASLNHSIRDFAKVLRVGFDGIVGEIDAALAKRRPERPGEKDRLDALLSMRIAAEAAATIGDRYADVYERAAGDCDDPNQASEYRALAVICRRVPRHPARSLHEAIQALWFAHVITCAEDHINANSIGRIDQILWPYYQADVEAGRIDRDRAAQLLAALWIKLYQDYDVQQVCLSGQTPDGDDATNELSTLCLDVTEALGFVRCLSVRVHRRTPRSFMRRALALVGRGGGIPFFFNDDAILPALAFSGITDLHDARDYAMIGCVEVTIPGRTNPRAVSHMFNVAKCLELAIHDGMDPACGERMGPKTGGGLAAWRTLKQAYAGYMKTVKHFARQAAGMSNFGETMQDHWHPQPFRSCLTSSCIERGQDVVAGGAKYNYHSCCMIGGPNVSDSLYLLDKLVFGSKQVDRVELLNALRTNFEGAEPLRQMLLRRCAKYGNDVAEVDEVAARVAEDYCRFMNGLRTRFGGRFHVHLFSFVWHLDPCGVRTGALPDGRRAGEPLAYSISPMQGRDERGLTAVLNSLARMPHHLAAGSSSAIIEVDPVLFQPASLDRVVDMVTTAIARGVGQLQFNVVNAETLRRAQADPDKHRNLCVRVSGFSQKFCLLDRQMQDHIIARTKHAQ